jgi:hypothetical protein
LKPAVAVALRCSGLQIEKPNNNFSKLSQKQRRQSETKRGQNKNLSFSQRTEKGV